MIEDYKYLYELFNNYNFNLINKLIDKDNFQLDFSRKENIIDKFSIIKNQNNYFSIIPLKRDNFSFKTKFNNLSDLIKFLELHLYDYTYV